MNERYQKIKKASLLGIALNLFLCVIKGIIGFITQSQAMIADAFNSASDVLSSGMTYIGNKIASIPSDEDHNLGHGKAEYIYSMLISVAMMLLASKSFLDSLLSLIQGKTFTFSIWLVVVCLTTILLKFLLYLYTHHISKKWNSILLSANSKDHLNDCAITFTNLLSTIFSLFHIFFIDGLVGILISIWIFATAIEIFKESYDVLMDKSICDETKNKVYEIIARHSEILKVIHFNSTPVGYRYQISFTIYVDGNLTTFESHEIANSLEDEIEEELEEIYLTVIHVNPIQVSKKKQSRKKKSTQ